MKLAPVSLSQTNSGNTALNANKKKGQTSSKRPSGSAGEVFINIQCSNSFYIFTNSGTKKRRSRCRKCDPCQAKDCAECGNCLDKAKFGGPNKRKSACVKKNKRPRQLTMGYIKQYSKFANQIVKERQQRKVESYRNDPKAALSGSKIQFEDYPVIPTPAFRSLFGEFEKFKNFYLPRIQSSNPMLPLFALKYLCQVKFREIFSL